MSQSLLPQVTGLYQPQNIDTFIETALNPHKDYNNSAIDLNINNYKLYNIKVKNFNQDIAYIVFLKDTSAIDSIYNKLQTKVYSYGLKNAIFIIYYNDNCIFITKVFNNQVILKNMLFKKHYISSFYKDILRLEGYNVDYKPNTRK